MFFVLVLFCLYAPQAHALTISGTVYTDEGVTTGGNGNTIKMAVGTSTPPTVFTSTVGPGNTWSFTIGTIATSTPLLMWIDGNSDFRASLFTKSSSSTADITGLSLYQYRVIVSHEASITSTSTTLTDLGFYDSDDDSDIMFNASSTIGRLYLKSGELHVWTGKHLQLTASTTGNASTTLIGDLHIATSSMLTAGKILSFPSLSTSFTNEGAFNANGGELIMGASSQQLIGRFTGSSSPFTLTVDRNSTLTVSTTSLQVTNLTIRPSGTFVAPQNFSVSGAFANRGTFTKASSTLTMEGVRSEIIQYLAGRDASGSSSGTGGLDTKAFTIVGTTTLYVGRSPDSTACSQTAGSAIGCELMVFDISSTTNPRYVAGRDVSGSSNGTGVEYITALTFSGSTLYVGKTGDPTACSQTAGSAIGCELIVFDISSTTNPIYVAGRDISGSSNGTGNVDIYALTTFGSTLYVGKYGEGSAGCSQTVGSASSCELLVFNISSTTNPLFVAGREADGSSGGSSSQAIYALMTAGNILYVGKSEVGTACSQTAGSATGCELMVFDISSTTNPIYVAGRDVSGDSSGSGSVYIASLSISGSTLYVGKGANATACSQTAGSATGCELMVFDISSTTNPIYVAGRDATGDTSGVGSIAISSLAIAGSSLYVGKFAHATACSQTAGSATGCELMVFDISSTTNPTYVAGRDASGSSSGSGSINLSSLITLGTVLYAGKFSDTTACSQTAGSAQGCELMTFSTVTGLIVGNLTGTSVLGNVIASGTVKFVNSASTTNFVVNSGATLVAPEYLTISGNFTNSGSYTKGDGSITMDAIRSEVIQYLAGRDESGDASGIGGSGWINSFITVGSTLYVGKGWSSTACSQTPGSATGCELMVFDISSTTNPIYVAGRDGSGSSSGTAGSEIYSLTTVGSTLYVGKSGDNTTCSQTAGSAIGCELMVFDISSTTNPTYVAGRDASGSSSGTAGSEIYSLTIIGSTLYTGKSGDNTTCSQTAGSAIGCELMVFDISSTTNPTYVAGRDASGSSSGTESSHIQELIILGSTLYVGKAGNATACSQTAGSAIGCEIMAFNISSTTDPIYVAGRDVSGSSSGTGSVGVFSFTTVGSTLLYVGKDANSTACSQTAGSAQGCELMAFSIAGRMSGNLTGSNALGNVVASGTMAILDNASTTNVTIHTNGVLVAPTYLSVSDHYTNAGTFIHSSGTLLFASTTGTQSLSGTLSGTSGFGTLRFVGATTSATTTGMVGKWMFEEATGTAVRDASGLGKNGSFVGAPQWTNGIMGKAIALDGVDDYVSVSGFSQPTSAMTFSAWVKASETPATYDSIAGNSNSSWNGGWGMYYESNQLKFWIQDYATNIAYQSYTTPTEWHHVAGTFDGTNVRLYVDTALGTSDTYVGSMTDQSSFRIGDTVGLANRNFPGLIDDVRVYNRALSASEILGLYNERPKILGSNASTTNFIIDSGVVSAPPVLSLTGNYSNSGTFTHNAGTTTFNGRGQQTLSGAMVASSTFGNLVIANTSANGTVSQSVVFANSASTSDTFTMLASTSAQFPASATSTFQNISLQGSASQFIWLRSSSAGSRFGFSVPGTQKIATYVNVKDSVACPTTVTVTNGGVNAGNNVCWSFVSSATLSSADNQLFSYGQATTSMSTLTITDGTNSAEITALNDIRILIATTSVDMRWDTTDVTATFGGTASAKVANPVSYLGNGSMLLVPVSSDFSAQDTLTISGLSFSQFGSVNVPISGLGLRTSGTGSTTSATDDKTVGINGLMTLGDHSGGQVGDSFGVSSVESNATLYAFSLGSAGENATTTDLTFRITGVNGITGVDMSSTGLYFDNNSNKVYDAGDVSTGLTGNWFLTGESGTLVFSDGNFVSSTTRNYVLSSTASNLRSSDSLSCKLDSTDITAVGVTTGSITKTGLLSLVQHTRGGGGGGGSSSAIGGAAPEGDGVRTGGGSGGGGAVDPNSGSTIGNEAGFNAPANNGSPQGAWTGGANAYASDGVYTTSNVYGARHTYGNFGFSVPSNNTITGFEVKIEASASMDAGIIVAKLSWDGGSSLSTAQYTGTLTTTDSVFTLGSPSDTWGRVWSASELTNGTFTLELTSNTSSNTISLDAVQVKVYHQASGGGGRGGGMIYVDPQHQYASVYSALDTAKHAFDTLLLRLFWWLE